MGDEARKGSDSKRGARWRCWDFLLVITVGPLKKYEAGE